MYFFLRQTKITVLKITKKGFSVAELVIVVAILGIMAAVVVPQFRSQSTQAKSAVAHDNLRMLRGAIELYTVQHRGIPPGYENDNPANTPSNAIFLTQLVVSGNYLKQMPENPFNNLDNIRMVGNGESFPQSPVGNPG